MKDATQTPPRHFFVDVSFSGKTPDEVIEKAAEYLGIDKDGIEKNACDEVGRVDFSTMEDDESSTANESDLALWKQGKCRLWYAVYTGTVERVQAVNLK